MNEAEAFANEVGMSYIFTHKNASAASRNSCSLQVWHLLCYNGHITHTKNAFKFFSHEPRQKLFVFESSTIMVTIKIFMRTMRNNFNSKICKCVSIYRKTNLLSF
jgi:hypothetical protein